MSLSTRVIAEAGVNHNGSLKMALELVDIAAAAGADYVKFQTFNADKLASSRANKAGYQMRTTSVSENQLDMLKKLELSIDDHKAILRRCKDRGIHFLSTPFDLDSLVLLTKQLMLPEIKLGSGELTNGPLLLAAGRSDAKIILSTGMGTLAEVEEALGVLAFAMCRRGQPERRADFAETLLDPAVWPVLSERVTLLHCTTEYPAAVEDTNLNAMDTMRRAFGITVGYSDHTKGDAISLAAVALGATVIEKHITLDRNLPGPDHDASLEPSELASLIVNIRAVEKALGSGIKQPSNAEVQNRVAVRKSMIATQNISEGQSITSEVISIKRPGNGVSPMMYWDTLGTKAKLSIGMGEPL